MIISISSIMKKPDKVHYIINEAVETCGAVGRKWSKPLVNGVLRKIANNILSLEEQYIRHPQWIYSHPNNLLEKIKTMAVALEIYLFESSIPTQSVA